MMTKPTRLHMSLPDAGAPGFTLIELLLVVALIVLIAATSVPVVVTAVERFTFNSAAQMVGAEIRATRYSAVAKNRSMVLRFNCPGPGDYRMVEFTGNAAIDGAGDRCSETAYPYPDSTPLAPPNADGPVRRLPLGVVFSQTQQPLSFNAAGRTPAVVTIPISNARQVRTITVSTSGRVVE